ncbi:hypothetical protein HZS_2793 [Henneguya salminicola]|nr:hypothetical protein HZS_2793 [Henneguya salminicola]
MDSHSSSQQENFIKNANQNTEQFKIYVDTHGDYWKEAISDDGVYYYNIRSRQTTWDRPPDIIESIAPQICPPTFLSSKSLASESNLGITSDYGYGYEDDRNKIVQSSPIVGTDWISHTLSSGETYFTNSKTSQSVWNKPDVLKDLATQSENILPESKKKPVKAESIPGTTWYAVLTGEGRVFFYDHVSRTSIWDQPEELQNIPILDKILEKLEEHKKLIHASKSMSSVDSLKEALRVRLGPSINEEINECPPEKNFKNEIIEKNSLASNLKISQNIDNNAFESACVDSSFQNLKQHTHDSLYKNGGQPYSYDDRIRLFNDLLLEKKVSVFSTYENELIKLEGDYRFELFPNKERKILFNEYLKTRVVDEKKEKLDELKRKHDIFMNFLKNIVKSHTASYTDILLKYSGDPRFKAIPKEKERESLFHQYIAELNKKLSGEIPLPDINNKTKDDYYKMLSELNDLSAHTPWRRVKRIICDDPRFAAVNDQNKRESWFDEFIEKKVEDQKLKDQVRSKIEREKTSIKERERHIAEQKLHLDEKRSRERESFHRENSMIEFTSLLTENIHTPHISWREAKKILKQDPRWKSVDSLSRDEYLNLFDKHLDRLHTKLTESFRDLLDESGFSVTCIWDKIYPKIRNDSRCISYSKSERVCKNEFLNYVEAKNIQIRNELRLLLSETKLIDHRFLAKSRLIPSLYDELIQILKRDNRYNVLDHVSEERREIVDSYITEQNKKGMPPPPTATKSSNFIK